MINTAFVRNRATATQIAAHLCECDTSFKPPLSDRVDISAYAIKINANAERFEAWLDGELVGLVAIYCNTPDKTSAFITSVSVLPRFQGRGIASRLIDEGKSHARTALYSRLQLEVSSDNRAAIRLYERLGFSVLANAGSKLTMQTVLFLEH